LLAINSIVGRAGKIEKKLHPDPAMDRIRGRLAPDMLDPAETMQAPINLAFPTAPVKGDISGLAIELPGTGWGNGQLAELHQPQSISPFRTLLAAELVEGGAHQEDSPAADPQFCRIEVGDVADIERLALVEDMNFHPVGMRVADQLDKLVRLVLMAVADHVGQRLVHCQGQGAGDFLIDSVGLADGSKK
jgi:hypothetical protein